MKKLLSLSIATLSLSSCTFILGFQKGLECGDGLLTEARGEECDDGNTNPADGFNDLCSAECKLPACGDGVLDPFPTVDSNGDGVVNFSDLREACDDGNTTDGDGCESDCQLPICGDGITETVPTIDTDADGVADATEACDDGFTCADGTPCEPQSGCADLSFCNIRSGDGCSQDCLKIELCGDAILDTGEQCDDGNNTDADGCEGNCRNPACGDDILDPGELCLDPTINAITSGARQFSVGDIDNDGNQDVAAINASSAAAISLFFGNGDGTFTATNPIATNGNINSNFALADFDGDSVLDLIVTDNSSPGGLSFIKLDANRSVVSVVQAISGFFGGPLLRGDFDGDGAADLFNSTNKVLLNNGAGILSAITATFAPLQPSGAAAAVGDLNGDLADDLVFFVNASVLVALNNGTGSSFATSALTDFGIRDAKLGDIDGDADLDLFYINGQQLKAILNDGTGDFSGAPLTVVDQGSDQAFAVDFSGDGADEMFLLDSDEFTTFALLGGQVVVSAQISNTPNISSFNFADLNKDGLQDLLFLVGQNISFFLGAK